MAVGHPNLVWAIVGVGLVAATTPLGLIEPVLPLLALVGAIALGVAAFAPKIFALLAMSTIVFSVPLQSVLGPVGRRADELVILIAFVAFCVRRFTREGRLVMLPGTVAFVAFAAFGILSALRQHVPTGTAVEGLLLSIKGLIFAFALAQLSWTVRDLRILVKAGIALIVVLGVTALANLAAPVPWSLAFTRSPPVDFVAGIPAISGPFQHPAAFGRLCAVLAVSVLAYGLVVRRSVGNAVLLLTTSALALLTFRVKSIVGLIGAMGVILARFSRPVAIFFVICFGPLALAFIVPPLLLFVGSDIDAYILSASARSTLWAGSVDVAGNYFPLGAGFGRYGSFTASVDYSPEYVSRGFENIFGLGPGEDGDFLNDTQWPAFIGEVGWIGTGCLVVGIVVAMRSLIKPTSADEHPLVRWLRVSGLGWMTLILIESIAAPVMVSPPSYAFMFAAVGVICSIRVESRDDTGASAWKNCHNDAAVVAARGQV